VRKHTTPDRRAPRLTAAPPRGLRPAADDGRLGSPAPGGQILRTVTIRMLTINASGVAVALLLFAPAAASACNGPCTGPPGEHTDGTCDGTQPDNHCVPTCTGGYIPNPDLPTVGCTCGEGSAPKWGPAPLLPCVKKPAGQCPALPCTDSTDCPEGSVQQCPHRDPEQRCVPQCDTNAGFHPDCVPEEYTCTSVDGEPRWTGGKIKCVQNAEQCPAYVFPTPPYGHTKNCTVDGKNKRGATCVVRCTEGFSCPPDICKDGDGVVPYTCGDTGVWSEPASPIHCVADKPCRDPPEKYTNRDCAGTLSGQSCTPRCARGFQSKGTPPEYTCGKGAWAHEGDALKCDAVMCREFPAKHTDGACTNTHFPLSCEPKCDLGFKSTGASNASSAVYKCDVDASGNSRWKLTRGSELHCTQALCSTKPPARNAKFSSNCSAVKDSQCNASCNVGFRLNGGSTDFKCSTFDTGNQVRWMSSDPLVCVQIEHKDDPVPWWKAWLKQNALPLNFILGGAMILLIGCTLCYSRLRQRQGAQSTNLLRDSVFENAKQRPDAVLGARDVRERWMEAERKRIQAQPLTTRTATPDTPFESRMASFGSSGLGSIRRLISNGGRKTWGAQELGLTRLVMFDDTHQAELMPQDWRSVAHSLGRGAYGSVYGARWRGQEVAVKELQLPPEPRSRSSGARRERQHKVQTIARDFVREVDLCCDLAHPNIIRLLGYVTRPSLLLVQELMRGNSLDQQLYTEKWEPTMSDVIKVGLDVATGMEYLHTAFDKPIIHRDLKSPNLLFVEPPATNPISVKITDFGLSKDKDMSVGSHSARNMMTMMMTGCGSTLWMAPEILAGSTYNETVDVYSFAMCLLELVSRRPPWIGVEGVTAAEVPQKVNAGERPVQQLNIGLEPTGAISALIQKCWVKDPKARPTFGRIKQEIQSLQQGLETDVSEQMEPEPELEPEVDNLSDRDPIDKFVKFARDSKSLRRDRKKHLSSAGREPGPLVSMVIGRGRYQERCSGLFYGRAAMICVSTYWTLAVCCIGGALYGVDTYVVKANRAGEWEATYFDYICVGYSTASVFMIIPILRFFFDLLYSLRALVDRNFDNFLELQHLDECARIKLTHEGFFGLMMFGFGLADLAQSYFLVTELHSDTQVHWCLFASCLCSTLVTIVTSWLLAAGILNEILAQNDTGSWMMKYGSVAVAVVAASASRVESIGILRTRIGCGRRGCTLISFPMKPKHFFFTKSIGAYHIFVKDIPHTLVVAARVSEKSGTWSWIDQFTIVIGAVGITVTLLRLLLGLQSWNSAFRTGIHGSGSFTSMILFSAAGLAQWATDESSRLHAIDFDENTNSTNSTCCRCCRRGPKTNQSAELSELTSPVLSDWLSAPPAHQTNPPQLLPQFAKMSWAMLRLELVESASWAPQQNGTTLVIRACNMLSVEASIAIQLSLESVKIQMYDNDFDEWCWPTSISDLIPNSDGPNDSVKIRIVAAVKEA
jgi:serine/threonine protein kinase